MTDLASKESVSVGRPGALGPRTWLRRLLPQLLGVCLLSGAVLTAQEETASTPRPVDYVRDIQPILSDNCYACHGPDAQARKAKLRLDTQAAAKLDRGGWAAVIPGDAEESEIILRIFTEDEDDVMPPTKSHLTLSQAQKDLLQRWIAEGAPWAEHWSFVRPQMPSLPEVSDPSWPRNAIDRFVMARLDREGLGPSPTAPSETLLRRLSLDLTGLPPTPAERGEFLDEDSKAWSKSIERLLASPRYGERMAWPWLDAARYADSNGYQGDQDRSMWPWRDWVVNAFNENLPFDQFTVQQLAGDLLENPTQGQRLATGFLRNHMINGEGGRIPEENRVEYIFDQLETVSTTWLGLTMNCCRCHDHKFDPLTNENYFELFAFFNQTEVTGAGGSPHSAPVMAAPDVLQAAEILRLQGALAELELQGGERRQALLEEQAAWELQAMESLQSGQWRVLRPTALEADQEESALLETKRQELQAALSVASTDRSAQQAKCVADAHRAQDVFYGEIADQSASHRTQLEQLENAVPQVMVMEASLDHRKTFLLNRGLYNQPRAEVQAGVPGFLPALTKDSEPDRLDLAKWLVSPENPLTARVVVNRLWAQVFGIGLVKTTDNFGAQGERPSHPELLDWLALEFVNSGWDVKHMLRLMVNSATYRQASTRSEELQARDPQNRLLARGARYRLPSWMIRDAALQVSGLLVDRQGGEGVFPYQPAGVWQEFTFGTRTYVPDEGEGLHRRSLYTFWRRIVAPTTFFDAATRQACSVSELRTNTPLHALATLNDTTYVEAARALAQELLQGAGADENQRIESAFLRILARKPVAAETELLVGSLSRLRDQYARSPGEAQALLDVGAVPRDTTLDAIEHAAWTNLALALLNLDEAITKE